MADTAQDTGTPPPSPTLKRLFRFQSALIAPRSPPEWISDRKM